MTLLSVRLRRIRVRVCPIPWRPLLSVYLFDMFHTGSHVLQQQVCESDGGHGFHDDNGAWDDDRIVSPEDGDL